ncbi:hypothetical protein Goarm_012982 [Gossypium armourianum]|uniref:DUF4283 domain-containing protein n=1 Tax=Gossypium armourianum TaxID=34283 RepID=A0A7J9J1I8_9ROSI|nr:hypothetical protein [Gossypium armourianum]
MFEIQVAGQNLFMILFEEEEDLETILKGQPLFFRRNLIIFYRLLKSMERRKIKLIMSPFFIKVGPCPPEYDKKDLMNAVGSTFGGVLHQSWFDLKECTEVSNVIKHLLEDDLPYSVALKVEFKLVRKVSQKLGANLKKFMKQFSYVGEDDDSTHTKCQSVGIRTPLMAAMDDTTWKRALDSGMRYWILKLQLGGKVLWVTCLNWSLIREMQKGKVCWNRS